MTTANHSARSIHIPIGESEIVGDLVVPSDPCGLVIFAHGSGSGRQSQRNRSVAARLGQADLATLLLDLLTLEEATWEETSGESAFRFDIPLLADRLMEATAWAEGESSVAALPIGYFGASTGAAAALLAAAAVPSRVRAVVSRGGRPDLAASALNAVSTPTLLIVGAADPDVLALNVEALGNLRGERRIEVVPEATHLFPEPGALELVACLATDWFLRFLPL
jgi:putative phosphoribosyl transferase